MECLAKSTSIHGQRAVIKCRFSWPKELAYKHNWSPLEKTTSHVHCHVTRLSLSPDNGAADRSSLENKLSSKAFEVGVRFVWTGMCFMVFNTWEHYLSICLGLSQHAELGNEAEVY